MNLTDVLISHSKGLSVRTHCGIHEHATPDKHQQSNFSDLFACVGL